MDKRVEVRSRGNTQTSSNSHQLGFTLVELLVLMAIITILAGMLLPGLGKAKLKGQSVGCLNNLKQLQLAWNMYADDHNDLMPLTWLEFEASGIARARSGSWVLGNAAADVALTNITSGTLFHYVTSPKLYACATDHTRVTLANKTELPVILSYSVSSSINAKGAYVVNTPPKPYVFVERLSAIRLPSPSQVWVLVEPNKESHDGLAFGTMWNNPNRWAHIPTDRHGRACNFSFADGHAASHRWNAQKESRSRETTDIGDRQDREWMMVGRPRQE